MDLDQQIIQRHHHHKFMIESCPAGNHFIFHYFGECLIGTKAVVAFSIGLLSICSWLVAQTPQLVLNMKNGNADSLSLLFLGIWLLGDVTNLAGAVLAKQLSTQIYTAYYFVFMDVVLLGQFLYYSITKWRRRKRATDGFTSRRPSTTIYNLTAFFSFSAVSFLYGSNKVINMRSENQLTSVVSSRTLQIYNPFSSSTQEAIGYVLGIVSALLYLTSRVPQIVKNFRRKSTGGLAFTMFIAAAFGNLFYSLGIFLQSTELNFLLSKAPWIVGSIGTLVFDFTIFLQFFCYKNNNEKYIAELRREHSYQTSQRRRSLSHVKAVSQYRAKRSVSVDHDETTPLFDEVDMDINGDNFSDSDLIDYLEEEEAHAPISPLIYRGSQKNNYFF